MPKEWRQIWVGRIKRTVVDPASSSTLDAAKPMTLASGSTDLTMVAYATLRSTSSSAVSPFG